VRRKGVTTLAREFVAVAMAAIISGCNTTLRNELPTWCTSGDCVGVPADIPRSGTVHSAGNCIWMDIDGQRAAILWPPNYTAAFAPAAVISDEKGQPVARAGEELTTVILGPTQSDKDDCGLTAAVQVYFDTFGTPPAS
jgi:hypothetical protein